MLLVLGETRLKAAHLSTPQRSDHDNLVANHAESDWINTVAWLRGPVPVKTKVCRHEKCFAKPDTLVEELVAADGSVSHYCADHSEFWIKERAKLVARNTIISRKSL